MAGLSGKKLPKARKKRWVGKILPGPGAGFPFPLAQA